MKTKTHKWGCGISCVLLVIAALLALFWPRERLLLREARRMANADEFSSWVSDHEFIEVPNGDEIREHAPQATELPVFRRHDLTTGTTTSFTLPYRDIVTYIRSGPQASPDGNRVLWRSRTFASVCVADLRTGRHLEWLEEGDTYHYGNLWMPDSHHWLQVATLPDGYLVLHSADDSHRSVKLAFPAEQVRRWIDYMVTTNEHLLLWNQSDDRNNRAEDTVDFQEYRLRPRVERVGMWQAHLPLKVKGDTHYNIVVSPNGKQIAWSIFETRQFPWVVWLHRLLPIFPLRSQDLQSIWVSRVDGSQLHEIGHLETTQAPNGEEIDVEDIEWLPDGKRLSFAYKGGLYVVAAQ